jgi:hypothetical protein
VELDHGHDVQYPVDLPVPGAREPVADLVPEEAPMGAVPFQEAKCARVGNLVMSPTSMSSRAALEGPIPCRPVKDVPVAASSVLSSLFASFLHW